MEVLRTNPKDRAHNFINAVSNLDKTFVIPFSLRAESDAHLFLCDKKDLTKSNCYWFQLRHSSTKQTAVRKCIDINLSKVVAQLPQEDGHNCSRNLNRNKVYWENYFNADKWFHFQLRKNGLHFALNQMTDKRKIVYLQDGDVDANHLIIHTNRVVGLWKIHTLEYLHTDEEVDDVRLGPVLHIEHDTICVSLLVSMCPFCQLKLTLKEINSEKQKIAERTYSAKMGTKWAEIRLKQYHVLAEKAVLFVSTIGTGSAGQFWAIDSLRQCQDNAISADPRVHDVDVNQAFITVPGYKEEINYSTHNYVIEYKVTDFVLHFCSNVRIDVQQERSSELWIQLGKSYPVGKEVSLEMVRLRANTTYDVRSVITSEHNETKKSYATFTTKCLRLNASLFAIQSSNTSATISLLEPVKENLCKFKWCQLTLSNKKAKPFQDFNMSFINLTPFTEYKINIECNFARTTLFFNTTEGVPNKISDLKFINSPSSLNLEWNKPVHIYGILSHYTVELQFLRYAACQNFSGTLSESEKLTTRESKIAITGLKPYCVYSFSVSASNTYFEGTPSTQLYTTPSSEPIHEQEIPKIEGLAVNASSVQIKFIQSPCDKIRGLLWMQLQFSCQQQWCQTRTEKSLYNTTTNYTLSNLYPYSNYTLQVRFSRSTKFENTFTQTQTFQTNSSIANEVRELLVYSKNESSISLRWRDPYPPTGVLLLYNIRYFSKNSARITTNVTDAPCKLWPTHQCFTISNLKRNQSYDVEIRGFNRDTSDFGSVVRINTTTKTERSMPPYDLRVNWSFTNVLELRWKHPNETNGDINKFNIVLIPDSIHAYPFSNIVEVSKFNYSLEYHCRNLKTCNLSPLRSRHSLMFRRRTSAATSPSLGDHLNVPPGKGHCLVQLRPDRHPNGSCSTFSLSSSAIGRLLGTTGLGRSEMKQNPFDFPETFRVRAL
ncbi:hypothetical protein GEV33_008498 [Tenebrio molitor]|uniref:Fibronectin type-III domain-containing protein n=1 Tax=Tenebrio molitor TaxID=7067 RepID=A0A8J6HIN3_TENMO|nr:hypothetical protein GEV33_008498 [Tenebrio molitor]